MTDQPHPTDEQRDPAPEEQAAAPEPAPEPVTDEPPPPPPRRRSLAPIVFALGAVVIGFAVLFLFYFRGPADQPAGSGAQMAALPAQMQALSQQAQQLAARPAGQPERLAALTQQVEALAHRPAQAAPDLAPIEQRLAALEQRAQQQPAAPDLGPLEQRVAAIEQRVNALAEAAKRPAADQGALAALSQRVDSLAETLAPLPAEMARIDAVERKLEAQVAQQGSAQADTKALADRLDRQQAALDALQASVQKAEAGAARAARAARLQSALAALDAGRPLGPVPDAPPAVARFADQPPPTLAALRAEFPGVADAALAAGRPAEGKGFLDRVWTNAQRLVTVRQGDRVLVGDPAAGVIARARTALDDGDLAGAVQAMSALTGPPAQAVAGWLASAKALLAARAALLGMAGAA
ncbi:MAG TPA: mitofilin family membrane protein [Acetobacteraceae bacterium]|nr:mitofilin family membrane protein [Acetobacteraceae bacterium]